MRTNRLLGWSVGVILSMSLVLRGEITVNSLFTDGAVLQRDMKVPVWGSGTDGEKVVVSFAGQVVETTVQQNKWMVRLNAMSASAQGRAMTIKGTNTIQVNDLLVGDVWLCSGQSNMEFHLTKSVGAADAIKEAASQTIRLYHVPRNATTEPQTAVKAKWTTCDAISVAGFSAVGYFFGKEIHQTQNVPVGLIGSYVGGTRAERWTSRKALLANPLFAKQVDDQALARHVEAVKKFDPAKAEDDYKAAMEKFKADSAKAKADGKKAPVEPKKATEPVFQPTTLYNAMIAPLQPYALRGAIWYQGESNRPNPKEYPSLLASMIKDWRDDWGIEFPFLFVQVAPWNGMPPEIREAQLVAWKQIPNTAMIVTTDVGDAGDIHPTKKQPVGHRLALAARAMAYGEKIEYSGPVFDSMKIDGPVVTLRFTHVGGGLKADGDPLKGFTIAGADKKFISADAKIVGDAVEVSSPQVASPVAVRYGWANVPAVNLSNTDGLPASPFKTDQ